MKRILLALLLVLAACGSVQPTPCADSAKPCKCTCTGGAPATGGRASTGGKSSVGGSKSTGGQVATGGSSAAPTTVACVSIVLPTKANTTAKAVHHKIGKRHHRHHGRALETSEIAAAQLCSAVHKANCATLDQGQTGSCTGNAHVMSISTQPFTGSAHCNETDARLAYQGGTCLDNGCSVPCTSKTCPAAFNPSTGANDNGSQTISVAQWMVDVGWLGSYTTADTTAQLEACLANGPADIGIDFWSGMQTPDANGYLNPTGYVEGGHDMNAAILDTKGTTDTSDDEIWVHNSWSNTWGWCLGSECGYARIKVSNLAKLNFDADCPVPQ